jgi:cytidylate kinase
MRKNGIIIAIDGPAGSGKSSVGREVAKEINYKFISTGKMYRAIAWLCLNKGIDITNENEVLKIAIENEIRFIDEIPPEPSLYIAGVKLEKELYDEEIAKKTSDIAKILEIRKFLVKKQQEIGKDGGIVMEGRDITTNVFPDAELKIYLDASAEERAKRRIKQLQEKGIEADYNEILKMVKTRDEQDAKRKYNPLKRTFDSYYIDTTGLKQDEVKKIILELYIKTISG